MTESPTWMALAPLLGFLLDALFGDLRRRHLFAEQIARAGRRLELVCRTAMPSSATFAGLLWCAWVVGTAALIAWVLETFAWSLFEEEGRFVARVLIVFAVLRLRRTTSDAGRVQRDLEAEAPREARERLRSMGTECSSYTDEDIAGATIARLGRALLEAALIPLVFALFGPMLLTAAAAARELGSYVYGQAEEPTERFYRPALAANSLFGSFAGWWGALLLQFLFPLVGGRRSTAFAGWLHTTELPADQRLAAVLARGLGLGPEARGPEGGAPPHTADIQRAVVLVWICALAVVAATTLLGAAALHLV